MFISMTARILTNTYCLATTRRFSKRSENSVGRITHEREAPTDTVQLVILQLEAQPCVYIGRQKQSAMSDGSRSELDSSKEDVVLPSTDKGCR